MNRISQCIDALENSNLEVAYKIINEVTKNGQDDEMLVLAEQLTHLGFLEEAARLYEKLIEHYPGEGELLIALAEVYIDLDKEEEAILVLENIGENAPSYPEALLLQADLYQLEGLFEVSEKKLLEAEKLLPEEPIIQFAQAELYVSIGRLAEAVYKYEKVLAKHDEIAGVSIKERLAETYSNAGEFEKALEYFESALEDKLDINLLFGYGITALQAGFNRKAIQKLMEVIELDPDYESAYLPLARAHEQEEELNEAYEQVQAGIKVNPFNKEILFYGGKLSLKLGKVEKAEEYLRQAIATDPDYIEAMLALNKLLLAQHRYSEIIEIVEPVIKDGDEDPEILWDFAVACQQEERYSDALNSYQKAYSYLKNNEQFLQNYGFFLLEEGIHNEAIEVFKQLIHFDPTNIEYLEVLERLEIYDE